MAKRGRPRHPDILTPREGEVLEFIRDGQSNPEIAERLGISVEGVKYHVSEILSKLGVASREEAARWRGEERRWWLAAGAPVAWLWRRAGSTSVSIAMSGGLIIGALMFLGVLAYFWLEGAASPSNDAVAAGTATPTPERFTRWLASWQGDAQTGWIAGSFCVQAISGTHQCQGLIENSTDGGHTWQQRYRSDVLVDQFQFVDALNGWAIGQQGERGPAVGPGSLCDTGCPYALLHTSDGGGHWSLQYSTPALISGISFVSPSDGWLIACTDGCPSLLTTADGGATWSESALPVTGTLLDLSRPTASDAWVLSREKDALGLAVTHDGGATWNRVASPSGGSAAASMFFLNAQRGWLFLGDGAAAGTQGKELLGTTDGGQTWAHISGGADLSFTSTPSPPEAEGGLGLGGYVGPMFFTSPDDGWLGLGRNGLMHTTDGGRTWVKVFYSDGFRDLRFVDAARGWAMDGVNLYTTLDGGATWATLPLPQLSQ